MAPHHLADVRASRTIKGTMLRRNQLSCIAKGCWFPVGVRASFFAKDLQALARCALVPLDRLGQLDGNMRLLRDLPFKCTACGSRDVALWLFAKRAEPEGWVDG